MDDKLMTDFAKAILDSAKTDVIRIEEVSYSSKPLHQVKKPMPQPLIVRSLLGIKDYALANVDEINFERYMVLVESPTVVKVLSSLEDYEMTRLNLVTADLGRNSRAIESQLDTWVNLDEFIIWLQCHFAKSEHLDILLEKLGNVTLSTVKTLEDDGVTQVVTTRDDTKPLKPIENPILLDPIRSFSEILPIRTKFVLRLANGTEKNPMRARLSNFSPDNWEQKYCNDIASWLKDNLPEELKVIA